MDPRRNQPPDSTIAADDDAGVSQHFKADRDEARAPLGVPAADNEPADLDTRLRRLEHWQLVRDGQILTRRYPTSAMRASLAFAAFVGEVAEGCTIEPEIVIGLSSVQVRLMAPPGREIGEPEVAFAEAIDFIGP